MSDFLQQSQQRAKAMPPRQAWVDAIAGAVGSGAVNFYFTRSVWHTLVVAAFVCVGLLLWSRWLRRS